MIVGYLTGTIHKTLALTWMPAICEVKASCLRRQVKGKGIILNQMCLLSYAINYYIENVLSALIKYTISAFKNNTVDSFDREKRWICAESDTGSTGWYWNMVRHNNMLTWDKNLTHNVDVNRFGAISCIVFYQNCIVSSLSEFKSFYHWPTLQTCRWVG